MSPTPSPFSEPSTDSATPKNPDKITTDVPGASVKKVPDIRRQAIAAIEALMAAPGAEYAQEQEHLLTLVQAHPGQPEIALAKHLLALRPYLETHKSGSITSQHEPVTGDVHASNSIT